MFEFLRELTAHALECDACRCAALFVALFVTAALTRAKEEA